MIKTSPDLQKTNRAPEFLLVKGLFYNDHSIRHLAVRHRSDVPVMN